MKPLEKEQKTFKQYRLEKHSNSMEISFGQHSLPKKEDKRESMETSFGQHSKKNLTEDVDRISEKDHEHIHNKVVPIGKLSKHELDAVKDYSDDSTPINSMLHRHDKGYDISHRVDAHETSKHLDSALNKHKTTEDLHVYTGIKYSPSKHFKRCDKVESVHLPAYTSTSSSFHSAREFSDEAMHPNDENHGVHHEAGSARHVLKIHVPKGTHAMSLMKHSFVPKEREVLLHRGHNLEIHHTPEAVGNNTYLWHAKIVSHKPNDLSKEKEL
jgi:hypothetical protein